MGGSRWCKNCHTSHEGPTGSKCQKFDSQAQEDGDQALAENQASNIALTNDIVLTEEQARLVAQQIDISTVNNSNDTSTGDRDIDAGQQMILQELQKMSKRFGVLEEQAAKDREVLTGLVSQVQSQGQNQKKVKNLLSPESVATVKSTCQSNVTKQRHKSGSKTQVVSASLPTGHQNDTNRESLFPRDNAAINIHSNANNDTLFNTTGLVSLGSSVRCHNNDAHQTTPQNTHFINTNQQVFQQGSSTVAPTRIVTTESAGSLSMGQGLMQEGIRMKTYDSHMSTMSKQSMSWPNNASQNCTLSQLPNVNNDLSFTAPQNQAVSSRQAGNSTVPGRTTSQQITGATGGFNNAFTNTEQQTLGQEHVIPSLQTLCQSAHINDRVQQRYQELEEAISLNSQGNIELLLEALNQRKKNEKIKVKWPQDLAFIGSLRKRPTYEQLSTCQWLLGFLRIRQEETDPNIKENMIDYLTELMQDACDYTWESAKGAHLVLLHRMADGVLTWGQAKEVHKIRKRYAQTVSTTNIQDKNSRSSKVVPCLKYNKGTCLKSSDHEWQNLFLKHMCQYCHSTFNKVEHHPRKDCWKAPKENPKN